MRTFILFLILMVLIAILNELETIVELMRIGM